MVNRVFKEPKVTHLFYVVVKFNTKKHPDKFVATGIYHNPLTKKTKTSRYDFITDTYWGMKDAMEDMDLKRSNRLPDDPSDVLEYWV